MRRGQWKGSDSAGGSGIRDGDAKTLSDAERSFPHSIDALGALFDEMERLRLPRPDAIGHRVVHGGPVSSIRIA